MNHSETSNVDFVNYDFGGVAIIPTDSVGTYYLQDFNPHMHEVFLQRYCMKWVPGDPLKEMIN